MQPIRGYWARPVVATGIDTSGTTFNLVALCGSASARLHIKNKGSEDMLVYFGGSTVGITLSQDEVLSEPIETKTVKIAASATTVDVNMLVMIYASGAPT